MSTPNVEPLPPRDGSPYREAETRLRSGEPPEAVIEALVAQGQARADAERIARLVGEELATPRTPPPSPGRSEAISGAIICGIGIVLTVGTYTLASHSAGGGRYVLAWGPMVFGGWRMVRGLTRM